MCKLSPDGFSRGLTVAAAVCLALAGSALAAATGATIVRDVILQSGAGGEETVIVVDGSPHFTAYKLGDPSRVVVDLQGAELGAELLGRDLDGRFVSRFDGRLFEAEGEKLVRVELVLRAEANYLITQSDRGVVVKLSSAAPAQVIEAADPEDLVDEEEAPVEPLTGYQSAEAMRRAIIESARQSEQPPEPAQPTLGADQVYEIQPAEGYRGRPISLDFKDIDVLDVFRTIAEVSGFNVVVDPDVSGRITIRLDNVPWDQALEVILKNQGLGKEIEGNIMRIATLPKLEEEYTRKAAIEAAKRQAEALETRLIYLSYANAETMRELASRLLSSRGYIIVDNRTNALIIKDIRDSLDAVIQLVRTLDVRTKQVSINAQIVTTTKDFSRSLGIQWGGRFVADAVHGNTTGYRFPNNYGIDLTRNDSAGSEPDGSGYAVNLPAGDPLLGLTFGNIIDSFNLHAVLSASESEGMTKLLSNPRVTASDNVTASIESGTMLPFETTSASGTQTTLVSATIKLNVTPHVTNDEYISMTVDAAKNAPDYANQTSSGVPILVNTAKTQVLVRDGDTLVIGGLNETTVGDSQARIPFLGKIPILGWLFSNRIHQNSNQDLLIFVTPHILRAGDQMLVQEEF